MMGERGGRKEKGRIFTTADSKKKKKGAVPPRFSYLQ